MPLLFKNCSTIEVKYLFIRFNKSKFFPGNTNNTDRNGVENKIHTCTLNAQKDITGMN